MNKKIKAILIITLNTIILLSIAAFFLRDYLVLIKPIINTTMSKNKKTIEFSSIPGVTVKDIREFKTLSFKSIFPYKKYHMDWAYIFPRQELNSVYVNDKLIYTRTYIYDHAGFRKVESKTINNGQHIILSGGSITFGQGIEQGHTLTDKISESLNMTGYNISERGYGPSNILNFLLYNDLKKYIREKTGILIYNYFDIHKERVCGSKSYFSWSRNRRLSFKFKNNKIINKKPLYSTKIINGEKCIELIAKVFLNMRRAYLSDYPGSKFYVFFPLYTSNSYSNDDQSLMHRLKKLGIKYIKIDGTDLSPEISKKLWTKQYLHADHHPNSEWINLINKILIRKIDLSN